MDRVNVVIYFANPLSNNCRARREANFLNKARRISSLQTVKFNFTKNSWADLNTKLNITFTQVPNKIYSSCRDRICNYLIISRSLTVTFLFVLYSAAAAQLSGKSKSVWLIFRLIIVPRFWGNGYSTLILVVVDTLPFMAFRIVCWFCYKIFC